MPVNYNQHRFAVGTFYLSNKNVIKTKKPQNKFTIKSKNMPMFPILIKIMIIFCLLTHQVNDTLQQNNIKTFQIKITLKNLDTITKSSYSHIQSQNINTNMYTLNGNTQKNKNTKYYIGTKGVHIFQIEHVQ